MRFAGFASGGGGFDSPTAAAITVDWAWVGNVGPGVATINLRSADAASVVLRYSTDPTLNTYATVIATEGADDVWTATLSGLDPSTQYYYGFDGSAVTGTFRTFPTVGSAASFLVAVSGDNGHSGGDSIVNDTGDSRCFPKIIARDPLLFWHTGDRGYPDITTDDDAAFRDNYNENMLRAGQLDLHLAMTVAYHWDDHDFGPNDSHAGSASKPAAQQVYREHVPHWPLPAADSIQQTFVIGRVRFVILDVRSYRSTNGSTDNSSKTMLGATQKQWLKDLLLAATEPLIVIDTGSPWNGTGSISWGVFSTERDELIAFFAANGLTDRLLMIHGDNHWLAADDGTNAPGGIPTLNLAPLNGGITAADGTWSEGRHTNEKHMYGTIAVADDGTDIAVTAKGYSVASGGTETERFSLVLGY